MTLGLLQVKACILHSLQHEIDENEKHILNDITTEYHEYHKKELQRLKNAYQKVLNDDWQFSDIDYEGESWFNGKTITISKNHIETASRELTHLLREDKLNKLL